MKKAYIQPLTKSEGLDLRTNILEGSTLVPQGGDKGENWNGEVKDNVDTDFGSLW